MNKKDKWNQKEKIVIKEIKSDSKAFYRYAKQKSVIWSKVRFFK